MACPACPEGKSAPAPGLTICPSCPAGTYSNTTGAIACDLCAKGKFSSAVTSTVCEDCDAGTYNLVEGSVTCDKCPAGQKMNDGSNGCDICPDGTFSNPGSLVCTDCEHTDGYVALAGESGAVKCEYCGPGFYADHESHTCKECVADTYSVGGVHACLACASGTSGATASTSCSPCLPGTIPVDASCVQCEKGEKGEFGADYCDPCNGNGQYADERGLSACKTAPPGHKPVADRTGIVACEAGTASFGAQDNCAPCTGAGQYADETGLPACKTAPAGHKPMADRTDTVPCDAGSASFGAQNDCTPCNVDGQYADDRGLSACKTAPAGNKPTTDRTGVEDCPLGTASFGARDDCAICAGEGQYADETGLPACKTAPAGTKPTLNRQGIESCDAGGFSVGGADDCSGCESGKTSQAAAAGCSSCATCEVGKHKIQDCTTDTETECESCPAGKASMGGDVTSCTECNSGGTYSREDDSSACLTAPAGKKPTSNRQDIENCELGSASFGAQDVCTPCTGEGQYADDTGLSTCKSAPAGSIPNIERTGTTPCDAGSFSVGGATSCTDCEEGKYSNVGAVGCISSSTCGAGTYTKTESSATSDEECALCEKGTASAGGETSCQDCNAEGEYADEQGLSVCKLAPAGKKPTTDRQGIKNCETGSASSGAQDECSPCTGDGRYADEEGLSVCKAVPAGFKPTSDRNDITECWFGTVSSGAQDNCNHCSGEGQYADETGLTVCKSAPAGYKPTDDYQGLEPCLAGTYSRGGKSDCTDCEVGKFAAEQQSVGCSPASACETGTFISAVSTSTSDVVCENCPSGKASSATRLLHYSACGGGKDSDSCSESTPLDDFHELPVRCCSDSELPGWVHRPNQFSNNWNPSDADYWCSVWSESDANWDCQYSLSHSEAVDLCTSVGGRLCTKYEVEMGCTKGTGCNGLMDQSLIWTSTAETVHTGQFHCDECSEEGEYSDYAKSGACKTAPAGHKPTPNHDDIEECPANTFSIGASTTCTPCTDGGHSQPGSSACEKCSTGKYYDEVTTECELCPKNTYTLSGATSVSGCEGCPDGTHSQPGAGYCEQCLTGKYYNETSSECEFCPKNTFSTSGASDINGCDACDEGGHSQPGSGFCKQCLTGKYFNETKNECELCPRNTFSISGATDISGCKNCPAGGHSELGSGYCEQCLTGKYYDEPSNECNNCPAGKFTASGGIGLEDCNTCENGFFSAKNGSSTCYTCEPGKYTNKNQTECLNCPAGMISGVAAISCTVCEMGKYAEGEGNVECEFCDNEEMIIGSETVSNGTTSASGCICPAGNFVDFANNEKDNFCQAVPPGVDKNIEAMTVNSLNVSKGYWRTSSKSSEVIACLSEDHCLGGADPDNQCKEGHEGPLCSICKEGFASTGNGMFLKCSSCENGDSTTTIIVMTSSFVFVTLLLAILSCCCIRKGKNDDDDNITTTRQADLHSKVDDVLEYYVHARPYMKIILSYLQVVGGLSFNFDIEFPLYFTKFVNLVSAIVNLEFLHMMPLGCLFPFDYHKKLLLYTLFPLLISFIMMVAYKILKSKKRVEASNTVFGWFLFMTFLILPSVSTKLFNTFACRIFDEDYGRFLKVDYGIDCESPKHKFYEVYAVVFIVLYLVGVPVLYLYSLRKVRKLLDPGQNQYESRYGVDEGMRAAVDVRKRNEEEHLDIKSLAFLYDSYEPKYYWFEVVETLRKLMLSGGLVILGKSLGQIIASMLICLGSMRVFAGCEPYIEYNVDIFNEMSQWQIFFAMFAALLIKVEDMRGEAGNFRSEKAFDLILLFTQMIAPLFLVLMVVIRGKNLVKGCYDFVLKKRQKEFGEDTGEEQERGVELGGLEAGGRRQKRDSTFKVANPIRNNSDQATKIKRSSMKVENGLLALEKEKSKSPAHVNSSRMFSYTEGGMPSDKKVATVQETNIVVQDDQDYDSFDDYDEEEEDVKPPPYPAPAPSANPYQQQQFSKPEPPEWTRRWDDEYGVFYYAHRDGETSTWDKPKNFVE
ncbi:hypothetical protein TL16_g05490 [Triparma laevis f. inornata]|uniref:WW domain-containing protein n=1 Tax=Triparma laevis f. inornata TaxID=1714386 RepID=A0A9W7EC41_9STRA|nr:hypothetical protein TL16_g05490 [Triparma laevis f. inornata]